MMVPTLLTLAMRATQRNSLTSGEYNTVDKSKRKEQQPIFDYDSVGSERIGDQIGSEIARM